MYKKTGKLLSLFLLLVLSFVYTDKVSRTVKENDPIMKKITKIKQDTYVKAVEPIINEDEMIIGYTGIVIDEEKSYKTMKKDNKFDKKKLIYKKVLPNKSITNNYDYYITRGNPSFNNISIIFKVNSNENIDEVINILNNKNIPASFFVDGLWLSKNVKEGFKIVESGNMIYNLGYDGKYSKNMINASNNLLESISLKDSIYCLNENKNDKEKDICKSKKMHTITPTIIEPNLLELKSNIDKGTIISYDLNNINLKQFDISINMIKSKGYNIVSLNKVLSEN